MDDPTLGRPVVAVKLGNETRHLLVNFRALMMLEKECGKSVISGNIFDDIKARDMKLMVWGALLWQNPKLTLKEIGRWIHSGNMPRIMKKVSEAWTMGLGAEDDLERFRPLEIRPEISKQAA